MPSLDLDRLDRAILTALQQNNLLPADRLAEKVGLSSSAVLRRIKRLRAAGVITADVSILDPKALGPSALFIVDVTMERENMTLFDAFRRRMLAAPEVQQCYYVTGDSDFIVVIAATDLQEYEEIVGRLLFDDTNLKRFRTSVVLNRVKASLTVPLTRRVATPPCL